MRFERMFPQSAFFARPAGAAVGVAQEIRFLSDVKDDEPTLRRAVFIMTMIAKAVRIDDSTYESEPTRRKIDTDRLREIIERDAPASRNQEEPSTGNRSSSKKQQVNT